MKFYPKMDPKVVMGLSLSYLSRMNVTTKLCNIIFQESFALRYAVFRHYHVRWSYSEIGNLLGGILKL